MLHLAYQVFPDSAAARAHADDGDGSGGPTPQQLLLAKVLKGVHW